MRLKNSIILLLLCSFVHGQFSLSMWNFVYEEEVSNRIAWYPFNNNVNDSTGNHNGETRNSPVFTQANRSEETGKAITLNGTQQYVKVADSDSFNITASDNRTYISWINSNNSNVRQRLLWHGVDSNRIVLTMYQYNFDVYVEDTAKTSVSLAGTINARSNYWHHVAMVYKRVGAVDTIITYFDGVEDQRITNNTLGTIMPDTSMFIGCNYDSTQFWDGELDDLLILNTALTGTQLDSIWTMDIPQYDSLEAWYMLQNNYIDRTGNGHNGSNGNGAFTTNENNAATSARNLLGIIDYWVTDTFDFTRSFSITGQYEIDDGQPSALDYFCGVNGFSSDIFHVALTTGGEIQVVYKPDASTNTTTTTSTPFSNGAQGWNGIVIVMDEDSTKAQIWVDGVKQSTSYAGTALNALTWTNFSTARDMYVGARNDGFPAGYFDGKIDDFRIYWDALTQSDIEKINTNIR